MHFSFLISCLLTTKSYRDNWNYCFNEEDHRLYLNSQKRQIQQYSEDFKIILHELNVDFKEDEFNNISKLMNFINTHNGLRKNEKIMIILNAISQSYYHLADYCYMFRDFESSRQYCDDSLKFFDNEESKKLLCEATFKAGNFYDGIKLQTDYEIIVDPNIENYLSSEFEDEQSRLAFFYHKYEILSNPIVELIVDIDFFNIVLHDYYKTKFLSLKIIFDVLEIGKNFLARLENVCFVDSEKEIFIFGDTKGQFENSIGVIFRIHAFDIESNEKFVLDTEKIFIFNGNMVGDDPKSMENFFFLLMLKIIYPQNIFLNRGENEIDMESYYNVFIRMIHNSLNNVDLEQIVIEKIFRTFATLPLATVVNRKYFVVHGGLLDKNFTIENLFEINRNVRSTNQISDLYHFLSNTPFDITDDPNYNRLYCLWYEKTTNQFLNKYKLELIIRSNDLSISKKLFNHSNRVVTVLSSQNRYHHIIPFFLKIKLRKGDSSSDNDANFEFLSIEPLQQNNLYLFLNQQ
ncbi:hypothetical protein GVAV_002639 [Gurleya vavrai]